MENFYRTLWALLILPLVFIINNLLALAIAKFFEITGGLWFFTAVTFTQSILLMGFTLYLVAGRWKMPLTDLGLDWGKLLRSLKEGLIYGPLVFLLVSLGGILVELVYPVADEMQPFAEMVLGADSLGEILVLSFFAVVLAPLAEELYFRGLLFGRLKEQVGLRGGIILSGLLFGLMHFDLIRLLPLALGGMALAWLYQKTGSIFAPITAHGLWNGLMLVILLLAQQG